MIMIFLFSIRNYKDFRTAKPHSKNYGIDGLSQFFPDFSIVSLENQTHQY